MSGESLLLVVIVRGVDLLSKKSDSVLESRWWVIVALMVAVRGLDNLLKRFEMKYRRSTFIGFGFFRIEIWIFFLAFG